MKSRSAFAHDIISNVGLCSIPQFTDYIKGCWNILLTSGQS